MSSFCIIDIYIYIEEECFTTCMDRELIYHTQPTSYTSTCTQGNMISTSHLLYLTSERAFRVLRHAHNYLGGQVTEGVHGVLFQRKHFDEQIFQAEA